jgi:cellulose synthase/poly-beta-1,6-N-acetylglucosamine synthase-like glycosyltransferase
MFALLSANVFVFEFRTVALYLYCPCIFNNLVKIFYCICIVVTFVFISIWFVSQLPPASILICLKGACYSYFPCNCFTMQTFHNTIQHCEYLYHSTYHKNSLTPPPFIEVLFQARKVSYHVFVF